MCHVTPLSQYQLSASTLLALEAPITCTGNTSAFFFAANLPPVPCMLLLLRTLRSPVTKLFALVARKFLFYAVSSPFHGFTRIHFHRIWLLLVIFMCNECRSFSQCQFVSSQLNCTQLLNEQIHHCVLVGMVSQTSLKLSYSLPSVDKIHPVSICSDSVFSLCFANSSFRSTNSSCSLTTCMLMSSWQSHCAWKNDSMSTLSRCVLLSSNHAHYLSQMSLALVQVNRSSATDLLSVHAIIPAALASSCCHSVSSFFCWGCASAGRTGHFRDPSVMPSRQWACKSIKICHFHLGQSSGPMSFSISTLKSLVVDMLRLISSLHITGTITITFTISQHCFKPKSHVPGPITCCGWGRNCFVMWFGEEQHKRVEKSTETTAVSSLHCAVNTRT